VAVLVDIDPAVFDCVNHGPVIKLLDLVAEGRHNWQPSLADAAVAGGFVDQLTKAEIRMPALVELMRTTVEQAAYPRQRQRGAVRVAPGNLSDLVEDLGRSAVVVVEDSVNDECFVLALAEAFGYHRIVEAERRSWLRFSHAGGKSRMHVFARRERRPFKVRIRVAALLDSDRSAAGQVSDNEQYRQQILALPGVTEVHMWAWREVENYVPCQIWDDHYPHKAATVGQIRVMPPHQRGYVKVKQMVGDRRGTKIKMPRRLIPDHVTLVEADFAELGPDAVAELRAFLAMILRIL
jgi:hypothetical protein